MTIYRTDNPNADFDRWDREQEEWLDKRPECIYCGKHIQDEFAYYINDEWICEECLNDNFRKAVEDHVE